MPHGRTALNLSGETEWMLTGSQRADYARDVAMMRSSKAQPTAGGGVDLSGIDARIGELVSAARQPQVVFQTDSVDKGIRQMRSEQNLQSLTFRLESDGGICDSHTFSRRPSAQGKRPKRAVDVDATPAGV